VYIKITKFLKSLPEDQRKSLRKYTSALAVTLNNALVNGTTLTKANKTHLDNIDAIFEAIPPPLKLHLRCLEELRSRNTKIFL
jgi:hypothetical protein